jgi:hypothetical protein
MGLRGLGSRAPSDGRPQALQAKIANQIASKAVHALGSDLTSIETAALVPECRWM